MKPLWSGLDWDTPALRTCVGALSDVMFEYARFAPATGAGEGFAWACVAAALALRRACSIFRICSGVGGFGGSFPTERVARGGVVCLEAILVVRARFSCA